MTLSLPQLLDADALAAVLDDPALRLFDATVNLARPPGGGPYTMQSGRAAYEREQIPGAGFADIPEALSDPDSPFPFTLPSAERFALEAGRLGIGDGTHVVVYAQDSPMWATRLWWQLRYFGFDAVSVLDGGLPAWKASGRALSDTAAAYPAATFIAKPRSEWVAGRAEIETIVEAGGATACLVNALTPSVFRGEGPSS